MKTKIYFGTLVAFVVFAARIALGQADAQSEVAQIAAQRVFPSPIEWLGPQEPPTAESALLLSALRQFESTNGLVTGLSALEDFLTAAPGSAWAPSVHVHLAEHYRNNGRYSLALEHWETAWNSSKASDTSTGKLLAARCIAGWTRLLASLGEKEKAKALLAELDSLNLPLGVHGTTIESTRGGLIMMDSRPGDAYRCGSYALGHVASALNPEAKLNLALFKAESPDGGFHLSELSALAQSNGIPLLSAIAESWAMRNPPSGDLASKRARARLD